MQAIVSSWGALAFACLLLASISLLSISSSRRKRQQLPLAPGPFSWPILGSLLSLRQPLHRHLLQLSAKYKSPVLFLRIGMVPYCVVNNAEAAREVVKTRDAEFAHRVESSFFRALTFGYNDIGFTPLGPQRTKLKTVATQHLFTTGSMNATSAFREQEAARLVRRVYSAAKGGCAVDARSLVGEYSSRSLCLLLFGEELVNAPGDMSAALHDIVNRTMDCVLAVNVGEMFPVLDHLDLQGITRKFVRDIQPELVHHLRAAIRHHKQQKQQKNEAQKSTDFVDLLVGLEEELPDIQIMGLLVDMVVAGWETSRTAAEWTLAELINHPEKMQRAQEEIDRLTNRSRLVKESELDMLPYMQAILRESLRLHPPAPLGLPHCNPQESSVCGYHVPAKSTVLINYWAVGRDPAYWERPEEFLPERFLNSSIPLNGQHDALLPFGGGRRLCPGYQLATRSVTLVISTLLQAFDWKAPGGCIDLTENSGKVTCGMHTLHAIPHPRLDVLQDLYA